MRKIGFLLFLLLCTFYINAQNVVKGTVVSSDAGEAIPGVSVIEKGTTNGTMTDAQGKYQIEVADNATLVFSFIGYKVFEQAVSNRSTMDITLEVDDSEIAEVVVVGYGVQDKGDVTGAVSTVDTDNLTKRQVSSVGQALQGQVAGLNVVSNSGTPGGGISVNIRGMSSISGSGPLFVVDGIIGGDINHINPQDIEQVSVLKDHSAAAIYGSLGSNGVVIITTKQGAVGEMKVTYDGYIGVQNFWKDPSVCTAEEWAILKSEALRSAGQTVSPLLANPSSLSNTNWFEEVSNKNAVIMNHFLSVSGGSDKSTYYLSGSFFQQDGVVDNTNYDRVNFKINTNHKVKKWLTIGEKFSFYKTTQSDVLEGDEWNNIINAAQKMDPASPVDDGNGNFLPSVNGIQVNNPAAEIYYTNNSYKNYGVLGDLYGEIKFMDELTFKSDFGIDYSFGKYNNYDPIFFVENTFQNQTSRLQVDNDSQYNYTWSNTLTYTNRFGLHGITAMIGGEALRRYYEWENLTSTGVFNDDPTIRFIDNTTGLQSAIVGGNIWEEKQLSAIARVNYDYNKKYLLTVNFRADGSSKFLAGDGRRWHYFPTFSLGWRITEENFMKDLAFINNLKLRGGWGQLGNQNSLLAYQFATTASSGANYNWGGVLYPGAFFERAGNPDLKWEVSTMTNIGLDFAFLKGKIEGSAEYYIKKTSGMLMIEEVPASIGMEGSWDNIGEMENKGFEFTLNYQEMEKPFKYSVGVVFATVDNLVTNLGGPDVTRMDGTYRDNIDVLITREGYPIAQFYGYETDGLFQNQAEVDNQSHQSNVAPGDIKYVDQNGDGALDSDDMVALGSSLPKFTGSLNVNLMYKGFDLNLVMQGVYGNKIFNGMTYYYRSSSAYWNLKNDMLNRWTGEGSTNDVLYPRMNATDVNNSLMSDRYIEDGSYLRIKTLQVGYTLPSKIIEKLPITNLRVYLNTQNLFTFTKYSGLDPEIGVGDSPLERGLDRGTYPQARVYSVGLSLSF